MDTRIARLGAVTVEHVKGKDYGPADWRTHPRVVQHTTESGFESAYAKLKLVDSPTFLVGRDKTGRLRAIQMLDLGRTAGCLEHPHGAGPTNSVCVAQIELAGYSSRTKWLPDAGVLDLLAHLYGELHIQAGLPLKHVDGKRDRKIWDSTAGVYGHADVPDQPSGHWDPGALDYATLLKAASGTLAPPWMKAAAKLQPFWAWVLWRDHGAPSDLRPAQIPVRVPVAWWGRYAIHRGL